ncbi:M48 family metalloprotease [Pontibacillus litoralis]|uniref:Peptidase M48 n=1 Tax=Pontibacillus litoralis JSM 072002 TaxID=1385512 RepID=A0A0A5FVG3_9BACI|nr:M48 family metalloprotease [Pontibacillus litoralis]KGX84796.1 peptidase M48 [Pontibacillus litoralis JSM 072002]
MKRMKRMLLLYSLFLTLVWGYFHCMYSLNTLGDTKYAAYGHASYFTSVTFTWFFLWMVWNSSYFHTVIHRIERRFLKEWQRSIAFGLSFTALYQLCKLPLQLLRFQLSKWANVRHQSLADWLLDWSMQSISYVVLITFLLTITRFCMQKFQKHWWIGVWLWLLPFALFVLYVQPIWIDPLFDEVTPLRENDVSTAIVELAKGAGISQADLYEVEMSEKTTTFNAYVTGIGPHHRIVLWDTMLEQMESEEILFIVAHEIGHYVMDHIHWGIVGYLLLSMVILYLIAKFYPVVFRLATRRFRLKSWIELRALPILLLLASMLMFTVRPMALYVSREMEIEADRYAIQHTENLNAAIESYESLAKASQSDMDPAWWIKWTRYTHPPIAERIEYIEQIQREKSE